MMITTSLTCLKALMRTAPRAVPLVNSLASSGQSLGCNRLTNRVSYHFGHVPISSKFHHQPLPDKVPTLLKMLVKQKSLDQKIVILQHLTETIIADPRIMLSLDQQEIIHRQLDLWKGRKGRFEKVATVAWIINKLNLFKRHKDLYHQIAQRVADDEWYVNFDESLKALEAFTRLEDEQLRDYIYPRIERNVKITVWEINMVYYQRITTALLEGSRFNSDLWDKLENHVLTNLGMEYSLKTITDIFTAYALARKGSDIFFQQLQRAIYLGHWDKRPINHKLLPGYQQTGDFYALLVKTYSIVKLQCDIYLSPDFLNYIYQGLSDRKTNYARLESFTTLVKHLPGLMEKEDQEQAIAYLLDKKKPTNILSSDILQFYDAITEKGITVPRQLHQHIQNQLLADIRRKFIPHSSAIQISEQIIAKGYALNPKAFEEAILESMSRGFKYLEGEEAKQTKLLIEGSTFISAKSRERLALPQASMNE